MNMEKVATTDEYKYLVTDYLDYETPGFFRATDYADYTDFGVQWGDFTDLRALRGSLGNQPDGGFQKESHRCNQQKSF